MPKLFDQLLLSMENEKHEVHRKWVDFLKKYQVTTHKKTLLYNKKMPRANVKLPIQIPFKIDSIWGKNTIDIKGDLKR